MRLREEVFQVAGPIAARAGHLKAKRSHVSVVLTLLNRLLAFADHGEGSETDGNDHSGNQAILEDRNGTPVSLSSKGKCTTNFARVLLK